MPWSEPRCRSSAKSYAKRSICTRVRPFWTSPPETATSRSPPPAAGAKSPPPIMCRPCSNAAEFVPMLRECRWHSRSPMRNRCLSRTAASMWWCRPSASCSRRTRIRRRASCSGSACAAARSAWPTGRRTEFHRAAFQDTRQISAAARGSEIARVVGYPVAHQRDVWSGGYHDQG